jgi:hypothetical protein
MVNYTLRILFVLIAFIVVFTIDYLFFRNNFWQRLVVNIGILIVFAIIYFDKFEFKNNLNI